VQVKFQDTTTDIGNLKARTDSAERTHARRRCQSPWTWTLGGNRGMCPPI